MTNEDKKIKLDQLRIATEEYTSRDQMIMQEFGFTITAFAFSLTVANSLTSWLQIIVFLGILFYLMIIANHMSHLNQDRLAALDIIHNLRKEMEMPDIHQRKAGEKRKGIRVSVPKSMQWFLWVAVFGILITTILLVLIELNVIIV